jgi:hypothetical protein
MRNLLVKLLAYSYPKGQSRLDFVEQSHSDLHHAPEIQMAILPIWRGIVKQSFLRLYSAPVKFSVLTLTLLGTFLFIQMGRLYGGYLSFFLVILPLLLNGIGTSVYLAGKSSATVLRFALAGFGSFLILILMFAQEQSIQCFGCNRAGNYLMIFGYGPLTSAFVLAILGLFIWGYIQISRWAHQAKKPLVMGSFTLTFLIQTFLLFQAMINTNYLEPIQIGNNEIIMFLDRVSSPQLFLSLLGWLAISGMVPIVMKVLSTRKLKAA